MRTAGACPVRCANSSVSYISKKSHKPSRPGIDMRPGRGGFEGSFAPIFCAGRPVWTTHVSAKGRSLPVAVGRCSANCGLLSPPPKSPRSRTSVRELRQGRARRASQRITSSALTSTESGALKPSALTVLKLTMRLNLAGRSIGRSAGAAPPTTFVASIARRSTEEFRSGP